MLPTNSETVDGKLLRFSRTGKGPPLILAHGYPDNLQIWSCIAPLLAQQFEVIAFDWPGMGCSDAWQGGATPDHLAERLARLMDHWKLERATILASDMGAQPALVFAARFPDRIRKLVVMNCLAFWDQETSWEIAVLRKFGWNRFLIKNFPRLIFFRALHTFLPHGIRLSRDVQEDLWHSFRKREVRSYISKMCAGYQGTLHSLPDVYSRITCPTLILWSENDKHFPLVHAEKLYAAIPHSSLIKIPDASHWVFYSDPGRVVSHLLPFLD